jgi:hypothetical protein
MSSRTIVTGWLTQNVGFPFNESELSPSIRAKIGQLTELRQQVEIKHDSISQRQAEIARLKAQKTSNLTWIMILLILGTLLVIVIVGAFLLLGAFLLYRRRRKIDTQIQQRVAEMVNLNAEMVNLNSTLGLSVAKVSQEITGELSVAHEVRTRGPSSGPTVQLVKETIREVVLIPCAYCHNLLPQTSRLCSNCGASRKA